MIRARSGIGSAAFALALCAQALGPTAAFAWPQKERQNESDQAEISRELAELYRSDQADQNDPSWDESTDAEFGARQKVRRDRVVEIVAAGRLGSLEDWNHAAMLLQHGEGPGDYLLAHVLSIPPGVEQLPFARFMTAATLDRFLQSLGRAQIFGTQMGGADPANAPLVEPFDNSMTESLRAVYGLPPRERGGEVPHEGKAPSAKELPKLLKAASDPKQAAGSGEEDPAWLVRAREIVDAGALKSAEDHRVAAQILLQSEREADLLEAHVLATAAAFLAKVSDPRLCAETLDRFLIAIERPQVFGTVPASPDDGTDAAARSSLHRVVLERYELAGPRGSRTR